VRPRPWTREELILALAVYLELFPQRFSEENPEIIALARTLNEMSAASSTGEHVPFRTLGSIKKKLYNFMALDPRRTSQGLTRGSHLDPVIWEEYFKDPVRLRSEVEAILSRFRFSNRAVGSSRQKQDSTSNGLKANQIAEVERTPLALQQKVLTMFLSSDLGYRPIEDQVFDRHRKGFLPWQIVRYYGLTDDDRGILAGMPGPEVERHVESLTSDRHIRDLQGTARAVLSGATVSPGEIKTRLEKLARTRHGPMGKRTLRVGQAVLRELLLRTYQSCCALCETKEPSQLVVSHIIPWARRVTTRVDPQNAILLCRLHDGLFDAGLIGFSDDYQLLCSHRWDPSASPALQSALDRSQFRPPSDFPPLPEYLKWHRRHHRLQELPEIRRQLPAAAAQENPHT